MSLVDAVPVAPSQGYTASSAVSLQVACAATALFLLPFPALNFGVSFTFADVFLVTAVLLNATQLVRLQAFQVPFLMALPLFVISTLLDPDGGLIELVQVLYIWGFVVPFGWVAFTGLGIRRIVLIVLASAVTNAVVAVGQGAGYVPELGNQRIIDFGGGFSRAAGLSLKCNSLVMTLTPCVMLIPCLLRVRVRLAVLLLLIPGLLAAVSKSVVFAVPGVLWYIWHEPRRRGVAAFLCVLGLAWVIQGEGISGIGDLWYHFSDLVTKRFERLEDSIDERLELIRISLDHASDTLLLGYGPAGTHVRMSAMTNNTVHVYYLGVVLSGGIPAALLAFTGMGLIVSGLWKHGQRHVCLYVVSHLLALSVMTALLVSFQVLPFVVGGAVLARLVAESSASESEARPRIRSTQSTWTHLS
jgi:hypothetical protein